MRVDGFRATTPAARSKTANSETTPMRTTLLATPLLLLVAACAGSAPTSDAPTSNSAAVIAYPLDVCVVTGNKLGSMGDPITKVYNGREVKFCCKPCVEEFEAEPAKYLAQLDATIKKG
jgi:YHS domain-containing protein